MLYKQRYTTFTYIYVMPDVGWYQSTYGPHTSINIILIIIITIIITIIMMEVQILYSRMSEKMRPFSDSRIKSHKIIYHSANNWHYYLFYSRAAHVQVYTGTICCMSDTQELSLAPPEFGCGFAPGRLLVPLGPLLGSKPSDTDISI